MPATSSNAVDKNDDAKQQRLEELEAQAVDKAKATADAAFRPSPSILNAQSAAALLSSVDGPSLDTYQNKESIYVGRSVPVAAGTKLQVPIQVMTPGSVVEYAVELKAYDLSFGITAEREEETTTVKVRMYYMDTALRYSVLIHTYICRWFRPSLYCCTHSLFTHTFSLNHHDIRTTNDLKWSSRR
jgi:hypothetical protein